MDNELKKIKDIITKYLLEGVNIDEIYEKIYNGEIFDTTTKDNLKGIYKKWNEDSVDFQIDLPYWYNEIVKERPTIMIVGTDANSKEENDRKKLILSAPFHSQDKNEDNNYNKILKALKDDCNIYLTDIFKLFFRFRKTIKGTEISKKSHQLPTYRYNEIHYDILEKEIEKVKPSLIITFGDFARNAVSIVSENKIKFKETISKDEILIKKGYAFVLKNRTIKLAPIPHPSNATYQSVWDSFLDKNNIKVDKNNRIEGTVKIIQELINELK